MEIVIIEDEIKTGRELRNMLESINPDITVQTILSSVEMAEAWFSNNSMPDLIFADIQLGDGTSFDIFQKFKINRPVIFCTAYDQYVMKVFDFNGIDYLLKPFDEDMLTNSLEKYERIKTSFTGTNDLLSTKLTNALQQLGGEYKKSLLVSFKERIIPVRTSDISFIYTSNGLVNVYVGRQNIYTIHHTLDQLEEMLDPQLFFKANRQFIIHKNSVIDVERYFGRRLVLRLSLDTPERILISRNRSQEFLAWLEY